MRTGQLAPIAVVCALPLIGIAIAQEQQGDPAVTEVWDPEPSVIVSGVGTSPPSDAIVLFDGSSLAQWQHGDGSAAAWKLSDGAFTVVGGSGDILTKRSFGDVQLHIEWRTPAEVQGDGQDRGNSGVFLQQIYEVQILDSHQNRTYANGQAASVYKQHIPTVNASKGPGEWQVYDIIFKAPRFDDNDELMSPAYVTVLHNNVLVQNHVQLLGPTLYIGETLYTAHPLQQPLLLQDHGNPVSYRNIWIRELGND